MARKFLIGLLLTSTLLTQLLFANLSADGADLTGAAKAQTSTNKAAQSSQCAVDPKFIVKVGEGKTDSGFAVKPATKGADTGFSVSICNTPAPQSTPDGK
jgi:hypothetical protein